MLRDIWISVRPKHWVKNILLYVALVFAKELSLAEPLAKVTAAFVVFCALASASYLLNDVLDAGGDRAHPMKKGRPIAAGRLSRTQALLVAAVLALIGLWAAFRLSAGFGWVAAAFIATHILYSLILQNVVILDVFALAMGYILRVIGGAVVIKVPVSPWLLICTLLLSLFIGLSARSLDFKLLGSEAIKHRPILAQYNPYLLDQMIAAITSSILITYTLYTISPDTTARFGTGKLVLTVPFALYGILRYLYLIHKGEARLSLERALIADKPMLINVILYIIVTVAIIY